MQLSIFDIETLPGMACHKPTSKYPNGRTGTSAGYNAHRTAGESSCAPCRKAHSEKTRKWHSQNPHYSAAYRYENRDKSSEYYRQYYIENQSKIKARTSKHYHQNKEKLAPARRLYAENNRDKNNAYSAWYRNENIERLQEYDKAYRAENKDRIKKTASEYYRNNTEKFREYSRAYRARRAALPAEKYSRQEVANTYGTVCYLCETEVDIALPAGLDSSPHVDHVHPLACPDSPGDVMENCRVVHAKCNLTKRAKKVSELTLPFPAPSGNAY